LALAIAPWHDRTQSLLRMTQVCFDGLPDTGATPIGLFTKSSDFGTDLVIFEGNLEIFVCSKILRIFLNYYQLNYSKQQSEVFNRLRITVNKEIGRKKQNFIKKRSVQSCKSDFKTHTFSCFQFF